jgi:hypothetical protein
MATEAVDLPEEHLKTQQEGADDEVRRLSTDVCFFENITPHKRLTPYK